MTTCMNVLLSDHKLLIVCFLNILINMLTLTTNAARVSGAETKRVATALSLFNVFQVSFRLLNMLYAPLMASIVDKLSRTGELNLILIKLQFIIFSAGIGSLLGYLFLPTFIEIYREGIKAMDRHGSIPSVVFNFARRPHYWLALLKCLRRPSLLGINPMEVRRIPRSFLIFNMFGVAIWTIGVIASLYASALNPDLVRTSVHLSGLVNGIGTILLFVLVEPVSALVVDQTASGDRPAGDVRIMVFWLAMTSILGNLLGMILLVPSSNYILWMTTIIGRYF